MSVEVVDDGMTDDELKHNWSVLLSRYGAYLGQAVPLYKLETVEQSNDGVDIGDLSPRSAIEELWRTHFSRALVVDVDLEHEETNEFPLLFLDTDSSELFLIKGRAGKSAFLVEPSIGVARELTAEQINAASDGCFALTIDNHVTAAQSGGRSAGQWFTSALLAYRPVFFEAMLATLVASLLGLGVALYTMQVYDRVVPTQGYATLTVLATGVVIAIGLELLIKQSRAYMVDKATKAIDEDLSAIFFGKALDIRLDARPGTVGSFSSQIRHFESVRSFMTTATLFVFADAPFALVFIGFIAFIGGPLAFIPIIMFPVMCVVGLSFRKPIEYYTYANMEENHQKNGLLIESIDGIESLKAVNADWKMMSKWRRLVRSTAESDLKLKNLSSLSTNLTQVFQQLTYAGMITFGAYLITIGELSMGGLIACSIIGGRALAPLAQLPSLIVQWQQAKLSLKNLDEIMALPGERDDGARLIVPEVLGGNIHVENASFAYSDEGQSLTIADFRLKPGERVAILGPVGSGKSTFLKVVGGFVKPQGGIITMDGMDVFQIAPERVRERVGYLPQDVRLFSGTLKENLLLGLPLLGDSKILAACEATGLAQAVKAHPKGLDLPITEGGKGLSGGQRQLVGITRMLLVQPKTLLMDEPTASMDAQTERRVMSTLFEQMPSDHSIVVVTHKPNLLPKVDRVVVLSGGRIVLDGPRDEVLGAIRQRVDEKLGQGTAAQDEASNDDKEGTS
jgi:ATP-binding cassette subfamily C protein LapB